MANPTVTRGTGWSRDLANPDGYADQAKQLARELRQKIRGEVRFDDGDRALYATDLSAYRQVPIGVVIPRHADDVVEAVAACRRLGVPILPRGCGTSLAGQTCNVAVVIDFSKYMHNILELNPSERYAWVEPGVICDQLRNAAKEHHLTWVANPATHEYCTFGGMIGNNSCGSHSVMGGKTVDNVHELDILTYEGHRFTVGRVESEEELERIIRSGGPKGEIYARLRDLRERYAEEIRSRFPDIPRRVSGYNLDDLLPERGFDVAKALVGCEGTCVIVLRAKVRLFPNPPKRSLLVVGYDNLGDAGDEVPALLQSEPTALEGFHESVPGNMERKGRPLPGAKLLPRGKVWLMIEFGGLSQQEANGRAERARGALESRESRSSGAQVFGDEDEITQIWKIRESGVGSSRVAHAEAGWPGWEDSAVHPDREGDYLRDLERLMDRYGYERTIYGHFGQGCFHIRLNFDFGTPEGVRSYRAFMEEAADLVVSYGGSISGEHGDGQARAELLPRMFGERMLGAFREFKGIWDPDWKMNPGKVVDPYPLDTNLRVGPDRQTMRIETHFRFPDDDGSLDLATQRCFGVGKCRSLEGGGTMCPSFQVLREEKHTTRGRAHMLFEMLGGEAITDGWKSDAVKESLDLCLSCKGCKSDCPESVDIATYKAEFLAHYYEGRVRPRSAYALGLIQWWSLIAGRVPGLANFVTQTPGLAHVAKWSAGIAQERRIPRYAAQPFTSWWKGREPRNTGASRVLLWPDTFNNYFHPETLVAGVEVLEGAGYQVILPEAWLCCGRPLYEYGMLDLAKWHLRQVIADLRPIIRSGVPVIGLEPGCTSVFRDELPNLFPEEEDAILLKDMTFSLGEFLLGHHDGYVPPKMERPAIVHGHCHHKAVLDLSPDIRLLQSMGLEVDLPDAGCCGMAGGFGYEAGEKYELSIARGEQALLPAVSQADAETLIIADGFSCRSQIEDRTDRRTLHTADALRMALHGGEVIETLPGPETNGGRAKLSGAAKLGGALLLGGLAGSGATYLLRRTLGNGDRRGAHRREPTVRFRRSPLPSGESGGG